MRRHFYGSQIAITPYYFVDATAAAICFVLQNQMLLCVYIDRTILRFNYKATKSVCFFRNYFGE